MEDRVGISCWHVAAKAIIGMVSAALIAWLFLGAEVVTLVASG